MNPPRCRLSSQQGALKLIQPLGVCLRLLGRYCSNVSDIRLMPNYNRLFVRGQASPGPISAVIFVTLPASPCGLVREIDVIELFSQLTLKYL